MTDAFVDRLEDESSAASPRVVSLPDGSVDRCYRVTGTEGEPLGSRAALGRELCEGGESFPLEPLSVRPGGQAVNAARQLHALGADAALIGHLDHPVLAELPVETHSMGEPATIHALAFGGEECLFPERGEAEWGLEDLLAVVDWEVLTEADALCCGNWVSFRALEDLFEALAERGVARPLVLDPGAIGRVEHEAVAGLFETLGAVDGPLEVVLSVNPDEYEAAAAVAGVAADPTADLPALRSAIGVSAVVVHGPEAAVAATGAEAEPTWVETAAVEDPQLTLGAGDRFSGAIAYALACDWPWADALALGNACASHFVATGETGDRSALAAFRREHG